MECCVFFSHTVNSMSYSRLPKTNSFIENEVEKSNFFISSFDGAVRWIWFYFRFKRDSKPEFHPVHNENLLVRKMSRSIPMSNSMYENHKRQPNGERGGRVMRMNFTAFLSDENIQSGLTSLIGFKSRVKYQVLPFFFLQSNFFWQICHSAMCEFLHIFCCDYEN